MNATMTSSMGRRFTRRYPCPICTGYDDRRLGDERCWGYLSSDGRYARCTRPKFAGDTITQGRDGAYPHLLDGPCKCGRLHGDAGAFRGSTIHYAAQSRESQRVYTALPKTLPGGFRLTNSYRYEKADAAFHGAALRAARQW